MNKTRQIFSFFSGVGFLDLGFETEGFNIPFVNEINKSFLDAYRFSRQKLSFDSPTYGYHARDVMDFSSILKNDLRYMVSQARKLSPVIGFIGGPPCPDFSIGGKNRGADGNTGHLSAAYIDLICTQKPDFFLYENVKGLWRTAKHREFFESLKRRVHEAGYITTEHLINAIEYGVPQDRDRIILLGFHHSLLREQNIFLGDDFVLPKDLFPWRKYALFSKEQVMKLPWPVTTPYKEEGYLQYPTGIIPELTVEYWFNKNNVQNHPNAAHHFQPRAALPRFMAIDEGDDSKKSFKRLHRWRYSPTVAYGNNEVHIHPYKPRRISAAEALALQSLPDSFALPPYMSLSSMFKTIGNGVPFLAAKALAHSISDFLTGNEQELYETDSLRLAAGD